jgi:ergothioneine biosynthesis protein EgtB
MSTAHDDGIAARRAGPAWLAAALQASRADTLQTFAVHARALDGLAVPQRATLNPPLWELGHIGWFQSYWLARHPARALGVRADPGVARVAASGVRAQADAFYNSSLVPHGTRWSLPLPDAAATQDDLARQLEGTLSLLRAMGDAADAGADPAAADDALYFFRLALLHEDMHHEAALYMAQSLGVAIDDPRWQARPLPAPGAPLVFEPGPWRLGTEGAGFAFDNERGAHDVALAGCRIDSQVLRWAEYLPFVEAGGYAQSRWWSEPALEWLARERPVAPRYLRRADGGTAWQQWRHGQWRDLDPRLPACHLTAFEAEAWCRWAGRRLPTEAEWERAAVERPDAFAWGQVWEWTASPFAPYPGFEPHPYRDYSAPWFGSRTVLRGASFMTQPRMRHPRYRNFFAADRNDVPAGLRTCPR